MEMGRVRISLARWMIRAGKALQSLALTVRRVEFGEGGFEVLYWEASDKDFCGGAVLRRK